MTNPESKFLRTGIINLVKDTGKLTAKSVFGFGSGYLLTQAGVGLDIVNNQEVAAQVISHQLPGWAFLITKYTPSLIEKFRAYRNVDEVSTQIADSLAESPDHIANALMVVNPGAIFVLSQLPPTLTTFGLAAAFIVTEASLTWGARAYHTQKASR